MNNFSGTPNPSATVPDANVSGPSAATFTQSGTASISVTSSQVHSRGNIT